jgi:hypothetical protein
MSEKPTVQAGLVRPAKNGPFESRGLGGASSGGKFVVSGGGEAYVAQPGEEILLDAGGLGLEFHGPYFTRGRC